MPRGITGAAPVAATESPAEPAAIGWGYRPHLDGLRAVAVYAVVAYHAGIEQLRGGFIGVDLFFVLSGFLVTSLLLRDLGGGGSIRLARFYARRARRLLPAALVVLVVTAVVYPVVASPAAVAEAQGGFQASALYVANWFFIARSADYFAVDVQSSPVLHFWSLAVEEQFYVVWPLVLAGLVGLARRTGRHRWTVVRLVVASAAVASLAAALVIGRSDVDRAYYGTDTRAYQLLAGALLALSPGVLAVLRRAPRASRGLPLASAASLGAFVVLTSSRVGLGPIGRGLAATVVVVVLLATLEAAQTGPVARLLAVSPLVHLGRISYGTYLWHWPVIIVVGELVELSGRALLFVTILVATGLASLSSELLELPVRRWSVLDRRARTVVAVGLAASLFVGLVAVPRLLDTSPDRSDVAVAAAEGAVVGDGSAAGLDWKQARDEFVRHWECADPAPLSCPVVDGDGLHVLVIGDSHANALMPMLAGVAEERGLRLTAAVRPVCPWQPGLQFWVGERADACERAKAGWYETVIPELDPDIVVLAGRPIDDPAQSMGLEDPDRGNVGPDSPELMSAVEERTREAVDGFLADDRRVVLLEPVPITAPEDDPLACLSEGGDVASCRFVAPAGPLPTELMYRELAAERPGAWSIDMDRLVCPYLPICDPIVDGEIARRDAVHVTSAFAESLAEAFGAYLDDNAILA